MKKHEIFKTNPNLKEVHITSDGQAFYNDSDAKLHAKSLKDKSVELIVNPDHIEVVTEDIQETGAGDAGTGTGEGTGAEGTTSVKDLSKMNKAALIAFAKENALEIDESLTNKEMVKFLSQKLEVKNNE